MNIFQEQDTYLFFGQRNRYVWNFEKKIQYFQNTTFKNVINNSSQLCVHRLYVIMFAEKACYN